MVVQEALLLKIWEGKAKRIVQERKRTLQVWRRHLYFHEHRTALCGCELQPIRFRKGWRVWGCEKSRCYLC